MSEKDTGGPAFPVSTRPMEEDVGFGHQDSNSTWQFGGMTLRDYFAAKAMLAICSDPHHDTADMGGYEQIAKYAYSLADAMLEARK